ETMIFSGLVLLATIWLFKAVPKGFLPTADTDTVIMFTEAAQGISFESMKDHQKALVNLVRDDPNILHWFASVGAGAGPTGGSNSGVFFVHLKPLDQREMT